MSQQYTKTKTINGEPDGKGERVDSAWVERYFDARDFFDSLASDFGVPGETHDHLADGTIVVTATDPANGDVHVTTFRPHSVVIVSGLDGNAQVSR